MLFAMLYYVLSYLLCFAMPYLLAMLYYALLISYPLINAVMINHNFFQQSNTILKNKDLALTSDQ